jgi:hypothetical protein
MLSSSGHRDPGRNDFPYVIIPAADVQDIPAVDVARPLDRVRGPLGLAPMGQFFEAKALDHPTDSRQERHLENSWWATIRAGRS